MSLTGLVQENNTTGSIANQEFIPYEMYITNKNLNREKLYEKHVKEGEKALKLFEQQYNNKKQNEGVNSENNEKDERNTIVEKIKTLTTNFFKQRIEENKRIIKKINKNPKTKIDLRTIEDYENLRNTGDRDTLRECSNTYNLYRNINLNDPNLFETDLKCGIFNLPDSDLNKKRESQEIIEKLNLYKMNNYLNFI
jgi:hypothetical protein